MWGVDYILQMASLGVSQVYLHNGVGYYYNAMEPNGTVKDGLNISRPHIGPLYYSMLIVNEAIGSSWNANIAELGSTNTSLAAYGIWEGNTLARAVVINSNVYVDETQPRPTYNLSMTNFPGVPTTVKSFYTPSTTSAHGM